MAGDTTAHELLSSPVPELGIVALGQQEHGQESDRTSDLSKTAISTIAAETVEGIDAGLSLTTEMYRTSFSDFTSQTGV